MYAISHGSTFAFISLVMADRYMKDFASDLKRNTMRFDINGYTYHFETGEVKMESQKVAGGYYHVILQTKFDASQKYTYKTFELYLDRDELSYNPQDPTAIVPDDIVESVADIIMNYTALPFIKEWAPYVCQQLQKRRAFSYAAITGEGDYGFKSILLFELRMYDLEDIIHDGFRAKEISIDGCTDSSDDYRGAADMDKYMDSFGQILADQTTKTFHPAFDPAKEHVSKEVNDFYDVCTYYTPEIHPYTVQKHIMEAGKRCLEKRDNFLILGEPGTGKTIMAIGTICASAWHRDFSVFCMVPSSLVNRWVNGIRKTVQMADIRVVTDMASFLEAEKALKNPMRMHSLWVIISANTAKADFSMHPAVVWSESKKCYVCPHCGRPIMFLHKSYDDGVNTAEGYMRAKAEDFLKEPDEGHMDRKNLYCTYVESDDENKPYENGCGAKLWTASTRSNSMGDCQSKLWEHPHNTDNAWIRIKDLGWIQKQKIAEFKEDVQFRLEHFDDENAPKSLKKELEKWQKAIAEYESRGSVMTYPNRYSIAHYVRKHLNKMFDFGIFDEVHELARDSIQGRAFGNLTNAVKKSIFLTGTLSDGYAYGMFYLLFRTQAHKMIEDGYSYNTESMTAFQKKYGVTKRTVKRTGSLQTNWRGETKFVKRHQRTKTEDAPGISPTLVADYLMDNMVSVMKRDIREDLCPYNEYPVGIKMDDELSNAYQGIIERIVTTVRGNRGNIVISNRRAVKNALNVANMFLDQPYGLDTMREDSEEMIELSPDPIRPKEQKLIDICKEKKEKGEKMLIYVQWTGMLDIINRLSKLLEDNGIHAVGMAGNVKIGERQQWLEDQAKDGVDAVILNPRLVGTGLNLLDYTTIIFYEIGNQLDIIRQAKDRSNRINQEKPVSVYFLYYKNSIQEDSLALISQKLKAAKAMEGDFTSSALQEMTDDTDILTKLVNNIVKNEHIKVSEDNFVHENTEELNSLAEKKVAKTTVHFQPTNFSFFEPEEPQYISLCA